MTCSEFGVGCEKCEKLVGVVARVALAQRGAIMRYYIDRYGGVDGERDPFPRGDSPRQGGDLMGSAVERAIRRARVRRGAAGSEEERAELLRDTRMKLGAAVLRSLSGFREPGALESFRLYAWAEEGPLPVLERRGSEEGGVAYEAFSLRVGGVLTWMRVYEGGEVERVDLAEPGDFQGLPLESIEWIAWEVGEEGFEERLALRLSRRGKQGYRDHVWGGEPRSWSYREAWR